MFGQEFILYLFFETVERSLPVWQFSRHVFAPLLDERSFVVATTSRILYYTQSKFSTLLIDWGEEQTVFLKQPHNKTS